MRSKKAALWSIIIIVLCLLVALAHSKEQTYKVTITIEKQEL
jgi:cell division protein FtsL